MLTGRVIIVTPFFYGTAGGAGVYYNLLSEYLLNAGLAVTVISEASTETRRVKHDKDSFEFIGVFPERCGRDKSRGRDAWNYLRQNFRYRTVVDLVQSRKDTVAIVVHSSFLNKPNLFGRLLSKLGEKTKKGYKLIGDVRDRGLPARQAHSLRHFDEIIACSQNVAQHLTNFGVDAGQIRCIPILQERLTWDRDRGHALLENHRISGSPIILCAGLIKESKGIPLLIEAFTGSIRPRFRDARLVLVGLWKMAGSEWGWIRSANNQGIDYVGAVNRQDLLDLMSAVDLNINPSPDEGMPRSCLEALAVGSRVLLPAGVPEFEVCGNEWILRDRRPESVAAQMFATLDRCDRPFYPLHIHHPNNVISLYWETLGISR